jgi:hypothetical protein
MAWTKTNFDCVLLSLRSKSPCCEGRSRGAFSPIDLAIEWALFQLAAANDVPPSEIFSDWYRARAASVDAASWFQIRAWRLLGKGLAPTDAQREW